MLELLPTSIKRQDDIDFVMKYLFVSDKDLDIIMHAFAEAGKTISAERDFKKTISNIFKRLSSEDSILSYDAKRFARIMSSGRHTKRA